MKLYIKLRVSWRYVVVAAASTMASIAPAQRVKEPDLLDAILDCRKVNATQRLACFETAAEKLETARSQRGVVLLGRDDVREKSQQQFGLQGKTSRTSLHKAEEMPDIQTVDSSVVRISPLDRNLFQLVLADKSVWRTTELARLPPRVGDAVHIKRGAFGSYLGSFSKMRSIRMERVY